MFCTFQVTPIKFLPDPHADLEDTNPGKFRKGAASLHVVGKLTKQSGGLFDEFCIQLPFCSSVNSSVIIKSLQVQPKKETPSG